MRRDRATSLRHFLQDASMTVEASLLMPLLLGVLIITLYTGAHVYDRTILTALAVAESVTGHEQSTDVLILQHALCKDRSEETDVRHVSYELRTVPILGNRNLHDLISATYEQIDPTAYLQKAQAIKKGWGTR